MADEREIDWESVRILAKAHQLRWEQWQAHQAERVHGRPLRPGEWVDIDVRYAITYEEPV